MKSKIWECKIGFANETSLPDGADAPMRRAVEAAFYSLTGEEAEILFSGWGGKLDAIEQEIVQRKER